MKLIESLTLNQVFVFGSNANGFHIGGAARQAYDQFGAVWGQAGGMQGLCANPQYPDKSWDAMATDAAKAAHALVEKYKKEAD